MKILKVKTKGGIALSVRRADANGPLVFQDNHIVKSGNEIYGPEVSSLVCNELIWVKASKPSAS
jgi:hypothetical protein